MDYILRWSELIAYITASLSAIIYICDTSYIYISGMKKYLKRKKKEKQRVKEEYIVNSLSNSRQTTPNGSMILENSVSSRPNCDEKNWATGRRPPQLSTYLEQMEDSSENSFTSERSVSNPRYNKKTEKVDFVSLYFSDSNDASPDGSPPPSSSSTHNRLSRNKISHEPT